MSDDMRRVNGLTFRVWKAEVDRAVWKRCGLGCDDLPDVDYWCLWDDGETSDAAAMQALEDAGFDGD